MKTISYLSIILLSYSSSILAEIVTDGSLGPTIQLTGPDHAITADFGQIHGPNLFHSFEQFTLNTGETATFSGPESIHSIINRVTGGQISKIDGTLKSTIPDADLYLLNPAGIFFGPQATLDISGAFYASTANTLKFTDGTNLATASVPNQLLTSSPPQAFGFIDNHSGTITINGNNNLLKVSSGNSLSLSSGNLLFQDSVLRIGQGQINLATSTQTAEILPTANDLQTTALSGQIHLQNSMIAVGSGEQSAIRIRTGQFQLENATLQANTLHDPAGKIDIKAQQIMAQAGSRFMSNTLGTGAGGQITIETTDLTYFSGENAAKNASGIVAQAGEGGGIAGHIHITTGDLHLDNGALLNATTLGTGQGGNLQITATGNITLSGIGSQGQGSSIAATTRGTENAGPAGTIQISAQHILLKDGAQIGSSTYGDGQGGLVNLSADHIEFIGEDQRGITSGIFASSSRGASGQGGTVEIAAQQLSLFNGANITANSLSTGQGGQINIKVRDLVQLSGLDQAGYGSYIMANASGREENAGSGGNILLKAGRLSLQNGAQIGTSTFGPGQGGRIEVFVSHQVQFMGLDRSEDQFASGLFSTSEGETSNAGQGGSIFLEAGELTIAQEGMINAATYGPAKGGDILVRAQQVRMYGGVITARSEQQGEAGQIAVHAGEPIILQNSAIKTSADSADGGNLAVTSPRYVYLIGSQITTSVSEEFGNGGNIILEPEFVVLDGSQIIARAKKGAGGNINIVTVGVYNFTGEPITEVINASSEMGVDGVVTISTPDNNAEEGLLVLSSNLLDISGLLDAPCALADSQSSFVLVGREGVPNAANDLIASGLSISQPLGMTDNSLSKKEVGLWILATTCHSKMVGS